MKYMTHCLFGRNFCDLPYVLTQLRKKNAYKYNVVIAVLERANASQYKILYIIYVKIQIFVIYLMY